MDNKLIAMISQPMRGKTDVEIEETRNKAISTLEEMGFEVLDTWFKDSWAEASALEAEGIKQIPVKFLAKSLESMSKCDAVYFCDGWDEARGCVIERMVAKQYGLQIIDESAKSKDIEDAFYTFTMYQEDARSTAVYPEGIGIIYTSLGLGGEGGEVLDKIKKVYRDKQGVFDDETKEQVAKEIGDVLWYCATLSYELGYPLGKIAAMHRDKLFSRKERGKLHGNGDER